MIFRFPVEVALVKNSVGIVCPPDVEAFNRVVWPATEKLPVEVAFPAVRDVRDREETPKRLVT